MPVDLAAIPHIEQYTGAWVMHEPTFTAIVDRIQTIDLSAHVAAEQTRRAAQDVRRAALGDDFAEPAPAVSIDPATGIAQIEIVGSLTKYGSSFSSAPSTIRMRKEVRALASNPKVKGIMLKIDCPGGTVAGTTDLGDDIQAAAALKPVHAYIEDVGASGGYWLAAAASRISANPTAIVGSIGVYGVITDTSAQAASRGVIVHVVKAGDMKGIGAPGAPITAEQLADLQRGMKETHTVFVAHVAKSRGMTPAQAAAVADGRVHVGENARKLGLVDKIQTFDAAMAELTAAVLSPHHPPQPSKPAPVRTAGALPKEVLVMSEPTTPPTAPDTAPKAASLQELKAALPNSTSEFREMCLEGGFTVAQATIAFGREAKQKADAEAAAALAAPKAGAKAVQEGGKAKNPAADGTPVEAFGALVAQKMQAYPSLDRRKAIAMAARENPEAHQAYVAACPKAKRGTE